MFIESSFEYTLLPFEEKKNNYAVGRLDHELVLNCSWKGRERLSENICFPLATQIAASMAE